MCCFQEEPFYMPTGPLKMIDGASAEETEEFYRILWILREAEIPGCPDGIRERAAEIKKILVPIIATIAKENRELAAQLGYPGLRRSVEFAPYQDLDIEGQMLHDALLGQAGNSARRAPHRR